MNRAGFTLTEMMVSLAASVILVAGVLLGAIGLHRTLRDTQVFATSYSNQRRLIDFVGRDLRRAIGVSVADAGSGLTPLITGGTAALGDGTALVFALPAYYQSDVPTAAKFDKPLAVVTRKGQLSYGDAGGPKAEVAVRFSKEFVPAEGCTCFVRTEAGHSEIIVRDADELHLLVTMEEDGRTSLIEVWFRSSARGVRPVVSTYDRIMLRNARIDG